LIFAECAAIVSPQTFQVRFAKTWKALNDFAMLDHLAYTIIYVDDLEKCTAFYRDVLNVPFDYAVPGWAQFKSSGAALVLHPKLAHQKSQLQNSLVHITFRVDDLDAVYRELVAKSVRFVAPPAQVSFGKHATLLDPEENQIDLIEWATPNQARVISDATIVNDIIAKSPEAMGVFEEHGIHICGGCIVLLNASVRGTAEYSGLSPRETSELIEELNEKLSPH
jgi:predicted enzyme related to lactoylglutathione lyase